MDHYVFTECDTHLYVNYKLLAYPITTELFLKDGYDFTTCNNVRDVLYDTDVLTFIVLV